MSQFSKNAIFNDNFTVFCICSVSECLRNGGKSLFKKKLKNLKLPDICDVTKGLTIAASPRSVTTQKSVPKSGPNQTYLKAVNRGLILLSCVFYSHTIDD